jgi:predicted ester cyclase
VEGLVIDETKSKVAVMWSSRGTNKTKFLGVGPTDQLTVITGIEIIEVQDDRIVRRWGEWDITAHADDT